MHKYKKLIRHDSSVSRFSLFWNQCPALLYALAMLIGCASGLNGNFYLCVPVALILIRCSKTRFFLAVALMVSMFAFVKWHYQFPSVSPKGVEGTGYFEIASFTTSKTSFGERWTYKGTLMKFVSKEGTSIARDIPCYISIPKKHDLIRPPGNYAYRIEGTLKSTAPHRYRLDVKENTPWFPIRGSWNLAELRFSTKNQVKNFIHRHIHNTRSATFLAGIATGSFDDREMSFEFGRFGLRHIMAISGFHFAIIAAILNMLFRFFISPKATTLTMIFLLSSYFLFLGPSPSIMRAWVTITIALLSILYEKPSYGLNSLGVAIIVILFVDPLMSLSIGFQFSTITTGAILLFYPIAEQALRMVLRKRPLHHVLQMSYLDQHGYCAVSLLRQGLALTIAVNIIAVPMMLWYFKSFPLLSLLYNLFFPFMVSISMLLLLLGSFFSLCLPPLGQVLHTINNAYTQLMLNLTYNMPITLDYTLHASQFPVEILIIIISVLFTGGILLRSRHEEDPFAFI